MYNAGEANSKIQADLAEKALKKAGVEVKIKRPTRQTMFQQVTESLANETDGITYQQTIPSQARRQSLVMLLKKRKFHWSLAPLNKSTMVV